MGIGWAALEKNRRGQAIRPHRALFTNSSPCEKLLFLVATGLHVFFASKTQFCPISKILFCLGSRFHKSQYYFFRKDRRRKRREIRKSRFRYFDFSPSREISFFTLIFSFCSQYYKTFFGCILDFPKIKTLKKFVSMSEAALKCENNAAILSKTKLKNCLFI